MVTEKNIKKHVVIIHAYSMMSVLQRKIVNVLLYEASRDKSELNQGDSVAVECRIPFSHLSKSIEFNSNNTQYLKEAIDGLAALKIEWNLLKDKVPTNISFLNLRVLHGSPTFYQDGTFNYSFHKIMLDLVNAPSIYGTIDLDIQARFESKYGHSLYENSTRFVNLHKNKIIQLDTFRKLLGVHPDKYPSIRELTRNVVKPAVEEVNDRAEFVVTLDSIKVGRKITAYNLSVSIKEKSNSNNKRLESFSKELAQNQIKQTFPDLSVSTLENILRNYSQEYILEKITYTKKHARKECSGLYPIPYFISALKHDYKSSEITQSPDNTSKLPEDEDPWTDKLNCLQLDLTHWQKQVSFAQTSNNLPLQANIQNIIEQCEEKIRQHLLEKSAQKEGAA